MGFKTLKPRVPMVGGRLASVPTLSGQRMAGRKLQDRRLRLWTANPHCASCGRLVLYPHGFEVDHILALDDGGPDTDDNCQVLCVHMDQQGRKVGCHDTKTRRDMGYRQRQA